MAASPERFDPYHKWLGIGPEDQPPDHYRLLGISAFESDLDVIANASDRQMGHVRSFQLGGHMADTQRILNELAAARVCLLDPAKKAVYDANLRDVLARREMAAAPQQAAVVRQPAVIQPAVAQQPAFVRQPERIEQREKRTNLQPIAIGAIGGAGVCLVLLICFFVVFGRKDATPSVVATRGAASRNVEPPAPPASPPERPKPQDRQPSPPLAIGPFDAGQAQTHQENWAKHLGVPKEITNSIGMKFVLVPPGEFEMGSTQADIQWCIQYMTKRYAASSHDRLRKKFESEGPSRRVRIGTPFYLSVYEVTQAEYSTVMGGNRRGADRLPAEGVRWDEAVAFCKRLSASPNENASHRSYRLPSEAEWEYACRAGNAACQMGYEYWYASNSKGPDGRPSAHPVGEKAPNPWGLYDMLGNVAEWCANPFDADRFTQSPIANGPANSPRAFRGGSYADGSLSCRPAWRDAAPPDARSPQILGSTAPGNGLRVCFGGFPPSAAGSTGEAAICDPATGICEVPGQRPPVPIAADTSDAQAAPLEFTLADAYGRAIRAGDYRGAPVLILLGACWCGGCQQDAETLRSVEQKYRARGLRTIRCTAWDNELPAWEFQKHYRLPSVPLQDPDRQFERRYNRRGWTFLVLADAAGKVVYRANSSIDWPDIEKRIRAVLPERSPIAPIERDGILYPPAVLQRSGETTRARQRDVYPSLACAADGRMYVAFTTNRGAAQDVYLRVFDGQKWLPDQPVAATQADEFDAAVIVDRLNRPWVSWTGNVHGPRYEVFVSHVSTASSPIQPVQITQSDDDAMHARMAADSQGRVWVAYYRWQKMHNRSRDKEVYAKYLDAKGDRWSSEIHVSPEDVPEYEDHTDPIVAAHGDSVVFGWSWDFHQPPGYSRVPSMPTIFLRKVGPGGTLARARAVSGPNADTRPALAVAADGRVWCAWESAGGSTMQKSVCFGIEDLDRQEQPGVGVNVTGMKGNVCSPCLAMSPRGDAALLWAEVDLKGQWTLMQAHWIARNNAWASPKTLVSKGNPRFPSAAYAKDGNLWVAYSVEEEGRRKIEVLDATANTRSAAVVGKGP